MDSYPEFLFVIQSHGVPELTVFKSLLNPV
jgi:hypothetical protein